MGCSGSRPPRETDDSTVESTVETQSIKAVHAELSRCVLAILQRDHAETRIQPAALRAIVLILHDGIVEKADAYRQLKAAAVRNEQLKQLVEAEAQQPMIAPDGLREVLAAHGYALSAEGTMQLLATIQAVTATMLGVAARKIGTRIRLDRDYYSSDESDFDSCDDDVAKDSTLQEITVAGIVVCRRHAMLRRIFQGTMIGSGLFQPANGRMDSQFRRWPLAFAVAILRDEWQFNIVSDADAVGLRV